MNLYVILSPDIGHFCDGFSDETVARATFEKMKTQLNGETLMIHHEDVLDCFTTNNGTYYLERARMMRVRQRNGYIFAPVEGSQVQYMEAL